MKLHEYVQYTWEETLNVIVDYSCNNRKNMARVLFLILEWCSKCDGRLAILFLVYMALPLKVTRDCESKVHMLIRFVSCFVDK